MQYFLINILIILSICSCSDISKKAEVQNNKNTNIIVVDTVAKDSIVPEYPNISKEYLLGKINPEQDSMFVEVPSKYCIMRKEYIHKDVLEPFIAMYEAAEKDGVRLGIISAFRSFD
ncbi:MAG: D-alanyl-D-alanine carboxypeptidase family protein, partial [Bacteroidales bacterium]|nr:D-alanyl-D-alanine carboxypeptidase family protein [Bacteroidales bacterium]